jgi:hypothetical protein
MKAVLGPKQYEIDDVSPAMFSDTPVQFVFERDRLTLRLAENLTRRGEAHGSASRYFEALADFRAAAEIDPHAPNPHYQSGFSLMHLERYSEAVDAYESCERLAPGWFNCRGDLYLARHLSAGRWPAPAFLAVSVETSAPTSFRPPTSSRCSTASSNPPRTTGASTSCVAAPSKLLNASPTPTPPTSPASPARRTTTTPAPACSCHRALLTIDPAAKRDLFQQVVALTPTANLMSATMARVMLRA